MKSHIEMLDVAFRQENIRPTLFLWFVLTTLFVSITAFAAYHSDAHFLAALIACMVAGATPAPMAIIIVNVWDDLRGNRS